MKDKDKNKDISDEDSDDEDADEVELQPTDTTVVDANDTAPTSTTADVEGVSSKVNAGSEYSSSTETNELFVSCIFCVFVGVFLVYFGSMF